MTNGKLVVGEVIGNAACGGVKSAVLNYLSNMDLRGIELHVFTYGPSDSDQRFKALGAIVHYLPNFIKFPSAIKAFSKVLKTYSFDVIHSHLTSLSVFALYAAKRAGVPVRICHAHSTTCRSERTAPVKNLLKKFCARYATKLCACSRLAAEWLYGKKAKEATILPNAIDLERFTYDEVKASEMRGRLGIKEGEFVLGNVARFEYQKNIPFLVDIFAEVSSAVKSRLLLVGGGSEYDAVQAEIKKCGVADKVTILPEITDVEQYYHAFDCFVLPSRYEGLPLVGVEAQAEGLPCYFSANVTAETKVADAVRFVDGNAKEWAKVITQSDNARYNAKDALRSAGFDIKMQAQKLRKLYFDEVKQVDICRK